MPERLGLKAIKNLVNKNSIALALIKDVAE